MTQAFLAGLLASSSLLLGAFVAIHLRIGSLLLGLILAFGSGVLISAVAYDLVADATELADSGTISLGLAVGAVVFFVGDLLIDRSGGADRKRSQPTSAVGAPRAIVLGTILDGIPESIVLGLTLLDGEGLSVTMFVAVFLSNLPEAIAATTGLIARGSAPTRTLAMWSAVTLAAGSASMLGYVALGDASPGAIAFVQAFAAGAILTMLADTMMPEAFEHGGPIAGLVTTVGFATAFTLVALEAGGF